MMLSEKYRPKTLDEVCGSKGVIAMLKRIEAGEGGFAGKAFWISGPTGSGKTTLAYIIAKAVADSFCVSEYVAGTAFTEAFVKQLDRECSYRGIGRGGRAIIVNEAHGLRVDAIRALLGVLDNIPPHVVWVFTTTMEGQESLFDEKIDASPLVSRCIEVRTGVDFDAAAQRVQRIAVAENLDGKPFGEYLKLIRACKGSIRLALSRIQAGEMLN